MISVSFHVLPSSPAGGLAPGSSDATALDWALDGTTGSGLSVIVPPPLSVTVNVSLVTAWADAVASEWTKINPKSLSGQSASVDAPAVIVRLVPLVL